MRAMESLKELVLIEVKTLDFEALVKCSRHANCGLEINIVNVNWHEASTTVKHKEYYCSSIQHTLAK